jgi:hypothetical protein
VCLGFWFGGAIAGIVVDEDKKTAGQDNLMTVLAYYLSLPISAPVLQRSK